MIIVDDLKLCFVQIPHTGSTNIGEELLNNFGGREILKKHSYLDSLKNNYKNIYDNYFIVGSTRNPLDERVSFFYKMKNNHMGLYSGETVDPKANKGGVLSRSYYNKIQKGMNFDEYILSLPNLKYVSPISIHQKRYDMILRFENLTEDFSKLLRVLNSKKESNLQHGNKTKNRDRHYTKFYTKKESIYKAVYIYSDFMKEHNYNLPEDWIRDGYQISTSSFKYGFSKVIKNIFWRIKN